MSGHTVNSDIPHRMLEKANQEASLAMKVSCPYCGVQPGQACKNKMFPTHPARFEAYQKAERACTLPKPRTLIDLPQHILKDIMEFAEDNHLEINDETQAWDLLNAYLQWYGIIGYTTQIIEAWEAIKEIKG